VGLLYGLVSGVVMYAVSQWTSVLVAAALTFAVLQLLSRFLHLDGLSDLGDGMVCGGDAERRMKAVKDSQTGAGGVGYVLVFSLLTFAALGSLWGAALFLLPLVAEIMNKNAVVLCAYGGKAREGLGNMFVSNTKGGQAAASALISLVISLVLMAVLGTLLFTEWSWGGWGHMSLVTIAAWTVSIMVGLGMSRLAERNFGAVNGDVLGATNEICRPLTLIVMLLVVLL
jgi:adenosylcobinamide-GDP ribazoletransferase